MDRHEKRLRAWSAGGPALNDRRLRIVVRPRGHHDSIFVFADDKPFGRGGDTRHNLVPGKFNYSAGIGAEYAALHQHVNPGFVQIVNKFAVFRNHDLFVHLYIVLRLKFCSGFWDYLSVPFSFGNLRSTFGSVVNIVDVYFSWNGHTISLLS